MLINKLDDSELNCSSSDEVSEESDAGIFIGDYSRDNPILDTTRSIDNNGTQNMSPIEEVLKNLSPVDTFKRIENEDGMILIYSLDEMSNEISVSTNVSDEFISNSDHSSNDPTLVFENMNYHWSPLEIIFEESADNDGTSTLSFEIELPSTFSFNEYDLSSYESKA